MHAAMQTCPEEERLEELKRYHVLDTEAEQCFDDITSVVAAICCTSVCVVSLVDSERIFFKSLYQTEEMKAKAYSICNNMPRSPTTFCSACIAVNGLFVINDARADATYSNNPMVVGPPYIRFYAAYPLHTPSGHIVGTLGVADQEPKELTKTQADALIKMAHQVESQLALRLLNKQYQAAQTDLMQTNQQLREVNEQKSRFLGMASHDLRQPLCSMQVCAELLFQSSSMRTSQKQLVESIQSSALHMTSLMDELLNIARADIGLPNGALQAGEDATVQPQSVLKRNVLANSRVATVKNINVHLHLDDEVKSDGWVVNIHVTRLEQILNNLLSNAIKYSLPGTAITVTAKMVSVGDEKSLQLCVKDQGVGIPASEMHKLFDLNQRVNVRPTGNENSHGIGLFITKTIIEKHNGTIEVTSEVGQGTMFTVTLPAGHAPSDPESPIIRNPHLPHTPQSKKRHVQEVEAGDEAERRPLRILVAEDDATNRFIVSTVLTKRGHTVTLAQNGCEALAEVKNGSAFDVILLDKQMPCMSGVEAATQIRAAGCQAPILCISGDGSERVANMDKAISKPFTAQQLINAVESIVLAC